MKPLSTSIKTALALACISYLIPGCLFAEGTGDYARALAAAVEKHKNGAPDAAAELEIVKELNALSSKSETAWLPDFWAAYFLTQITMRHPEERKERLARAQTHLDRAKKRAADDSASPGADLHALQNLIYSFVQGGIQDQEERERIKTLSQAELAKAYELDPGSPVVMIHAGTDLISDGNREKDWSKVMGGLALLHQAEVRFTATKTPRGLTTHYNSEWIKPWADWVYRLYEGGFDTD